MSLSVKIKEYTTDLRQRNLLRSRVSTHAAEMIYFDRNDYLSLALDSRLALAYQHGFSLFPVGSGGSMMLSGYHKNHQRVEREFAELLAVDDCILFSSGYAANLAVTALLGTLKAHCLIDKDVHASIYDGLSLSKVSFSRYMGDDLTTLANKLNDYSNMVLITEGIFSMSGQMPDLKEISKNCAKYKSELIVDEAHSFGILGPSGRGAVSAHTLTQEQVPLRIIPLGKAFAAQGAIVAGQKEWIDGLLQAGRSLIYSTAISPALSYGLLKTIELVVNADDRRHQLKQLIATFKDCISVSPLRWRDSATPIQQLQLGNPHLALHFAQELKKYGFSCSAIRSPTVSIKNTGLRVILNYAHEPTHIYQLFNKLHCIYEHTHS